MKPINDFLLELTAIDVRIWSEDGRLKINAPDGAMTPAIRSELAARKGEILDLLDQTASATANRQIPPFDRTRPIPLTHGQERIWSLARMEPGSSRYNVPLVFELIGSLDIASLESALSELAKRHEILRTTFPGEDPETVRQVISRESTQVIPVTDISRDLKRFSGERINAELERMLGDEAHQPFDIVHGPLWRPALFRAGRKRHFLSCTMHHLIFDGVSLPIFLGELSLFYKAFQNRKVPELPPLALQFADFAGWQRSPSEEAAMQRQMDYWSSRLSGEVPALKLPNDRRRNSTPSKSGSMPFHIDRKLSQAVLDLCRNERSSPYVVMLSAFVVTLYSFTGQEDMILCSPAASREHSDLEPLLGYFNSLIAVRADPAGSLSFREFLARVRRTVLDACDHQRVPLQKLAQFSNLVRTPLTRAMFSFQEYDSRNFDFPGIRATQVRIRKDSPDFELALYSTLEGGVFAGTLDFHAGLFSGETISGLLERFEEILASVAADPSLPLGKFVEAGRTDEARKRLVEHPQIDDAFLMQSRKTGGLIAYLVLNEDDIPSLDNVQDHAISVLPDWLVPDLYIPLDKLPRLPDGSVDVVALPAAEARSSPCRNYLAPRTPLEKQLAEIWKKVLWLEHDVSVASSFRDLGGHSLLSVQLVLEVEKALGRPIPEAVLGNLDTIEAMAKALESGNGEENPLNPGNPPIHSGLPQEIYRGLLSYTSSWEGNRNDSGSVIVGLNCGGDRPALFWCLQREYELSQLARYLGPGQPVYGMRSGNRVMVKNWVNVKLLAEHYVYEILQIQPRGPYLIGGNCQAASIAFYAAKKLQALGHEITLLILHERFVPDDYEGPVALSFGKDSNRNPHFSFHRPETGWWKYYSGPLRETIVPGAHGQFFEEPNIQVLAETLKARFDEAARADFSEWEAVGDGKTRHPLPKTAFRARITGPSDLSMRPGETNILTVELTNISPALWQSSQCSGVYLGNHWLNSRGKIVQFLDGRSELPNALEPGESIRLALQITAPRKPDSYKLEIDLVDEGVCWFKDRGSTPLQIPVRVRTGRPSFFRTLWKPLHHD